MQDIKRLKFVTVVGELEGVLVGGGGGGGGEYKEEEEDEGGLVLFLKEL